MGNIQQCMSDKPAWFIYLLIILSIWDGVWKLIAMWKSARNKQLAWFICIAIFNTIGILPIVYLLIHKEKTHTEENS
ncbi:MAG TPA: DUF5652 family protein [Bacteroidales bacterium]|nr:DUF5652 family protein [Bacteroidales bacterium]